MQQPSVWWGSFAVPEGRSGRFRVGPLRLDVARLPHEWVVSHDVSDDDGDDAVSVEVPAPAEELPRSARVARYATSSDTPRLRVEPVLPDRSVVIRPERALTILPRTTVTLFVGSPVWIRLSQGEGELLGELPASRPKETWLGANTREGEICYASNTFGRLAIEQLSLRPHRVVTAVAIRNEAGAAFECERVSLPVRRLSLFASPEGRLWTEPVTLERTSADGFAELRVGEGPEVVGERLTGPRDPGGHQLFRAFGTLFG